MIISLFTSRLILEALGVDNFGIYNVVGGFVGMFSIISGSLSSSISRYLTYTLGKGDLRVMKTVFATSVNVQLILAVVIVIVGETVGLWFLNYKMNIPPGRMYAANWVLQCSIFSFVMGLICTPYNASIIAHEKMNVFAYMTILDVILKLVFVYVLFITPFDILITYSVSLVLISLLMRIIYGVYCTRKFKECRYEFVFDKKLLKQMTGFAWWSFFGNTAYIFNTQGVNMLINVFFGVIFNAARGIVGQVERAVMSLVGQLSTAFTPQITKSYAEGNKEYMFSIINRGTKLSIFLYLLILIPLEFEAPIVLKIWLNDVPDYSVLFLRLSLFCNLIMQLGGPSYTAVMATGDIKNYQIAVTIVGCLVFPVTFIFYKLRFSVQSTYFVYIVIYSILIYIRLIFMKKLLGYNPMEFFNKVLIRVIITTLMSMVIPSLIFVLMDDTISRLVILTLSSLISTSTIIFVLGFTQSERQFISQKIFDILKRKGITIPIKILCK